MSSVSVNPPKTPVTKGSSGIAAATVPNVCKMPGPPAPFVPVLLPNIGKSSDAPKGYSKKVKVEGQPIAIKGASFRSVGDIASKGTGGGIVSSNTHGLTKFIGPGSFDVKIEGKNVQLLADPMVNNSGSPPNSAATAVVQGVLVVPKEGDGDLNCPHPNMTYDDPAKDPARRREMDQKIANDAAAADTHLNDAIAHEAAGDQASCRKALNLAIEKSRSSRATAFEKKVSQDTNAREVSKKFECPHCLMSGEMDVVTDQGIIKECKTGRPKLKQLQKIVSAAAVIFPGAPVHLAVPTGMAVSTPWPKIQRH
jgi:hypothetical protein